MLVIDNKEITTSIRDLLEYLQQACVANHTGRLKDIVIKGNNARINCPFHKDGLEQHPSCDVLLEDKGNISAGTVHCFTCGYKASFIKLVADCLFISYKQAIEWILSISDFQYLESTRDVGDIIIENKVVDPYSHILGVSVDELKKYDYIHDYMYKRKLTDEIIYKFDIGYDPESDSLTFPVFVNGKCIFIARRKVKYKRFDMPDISPKPIYGLDYCNTIDDLIVCESVINALTCWSYGKQAVALFGTGSQYQIEQLNKVANRHIIVALDGDQAGINGTKRLLEGLSNKIVTYYKLPIGKDINDLTKEEFLSLEEHF